MHDPQSVVEAPAKQFAIAGRHEDTRRRNIFSRADQGFDIIVAQSDGVTGNATTVFDNVRGALRDYARATVA